MPRPPLRRPAAPCPPSLEALEDRTLLSVSPTGELYAGALANGSSVDFEGQLTIAWQPSDTRYAEQWDFANTGQKGGTVGADVNAQAAWGVTTGNTRTVVAVLDSGIDYGHEDLYLNIWLNQKEIPAARRARLIDTDGDGLITFRDLTDKRNQGAGKITDLNGNKRIDGGDVLRPMIKDAQGRDTGNGGWADGLSQDGDKWVDDLIGWNFSGNNNNPRDDYGHGTHVAGTVGAVGNNGVGVAGIAWRTQLMPVRFFNATGQATPDQYIAALEYSIAKGAKISVNSFTSGYNASIEAAVKKAQAAGQVYVAAAGNAGRNTDSAPNYPSGFNYDNIIAVGGTTRTDTLAIWSNHGVQSVDIAAPGTDILSTNVGNYIYRSGTSMATPHVAGVVALVWGLRPEWNYRQVINHVLGTGEDLPALRGKVAHGRVDAFAAVRVPPRDGPQPSSVRITGTTPNGGLKPASLRPASPSPAETDSLSIPEVIPAGPLLISPATGASPRLVPMAVTSVRRPADVVIVPPEERRQQPAPQPVPPLSSARIADWLYTEDPLLRRLHDHEKEAGPAPAKPHNTQSPSEPLEG